MGPLAIWDAFLARIKANERLHLTWCCGGVISCLVLYGYLQVTRVSQYACRIHNSGLPSDRT
jgi:hypothetical protein